MFDPIHTRRDLLAGGATDRQISRAIADGRLLRLRGGLYADPRLDLDAQRALTLGGRPACLTQLARLGVWVLRDDRLHVHYPPTSSRWATADGVVWHWVALTSTPTDTGVDVVDALIQAATCAPRRVALAALDSALHLRLIDGADLRAIAGSSPHAARITAKVDGAAESGLETFVRSLAIGLGFAVESQVRFAGIGRTDLVIEDQIVVEADGDEFHSGLAARRRDRSRDAALARIGKTPLRFGYDQLVGRPADVAGAIIGAVRSNRNVKDGGRLAARAQRRLQDPGFFLDS